MLSSLVDPTLTKEILEQVGGVITFGDLEYISGGELHKVVVEYITNYVREVLVRRSELM